ncbi:hypothetical protein FBEOM_12678 [Fusarium beomiforme]|uniref:Uncharacterized protein n=1 Tax=Fusarium beomiforme TaxID=44412 RepID=A0A9P5A7R1_9HYPO|nr:hypothetical protein FBEOM_12678 [Fusarium beomiforme]
MGGESDRRSEEHGPGGALKDISDQLGPKSEDEGPYEEPKYSKFDDRRTKNDPSADSAMPDVVETVKTSDHQQKLLKVNPGMITRITSTLIPFGSLESTPKVEKEREKKPSQKPDTQKEKKLQGEVTRLKIEKTSLNRKVQDLTIERDSLSKDLEASKGLVQQWKDWKIELDKQRRANAEELNNAKALYNRLHEDYLKLKRTKKDLEFELAEERGMNEALQKEIDDQEDVVTEAHSRAISLLAGHVSSDFPDDQVRIELQELFDKCSEWCMDNRMPRVRNVEETRQLMLSEGIIRELDYEEHLRFDMEHRTATAVLLQAALAKRLVQTFLGDPFFLGQHCMQRTALQGGVGAEATVTWRIQTCQYLEQAFPPHKQALQSCAETFAKTYELLIEPLDGESFTQLTKLFEDTCSLALRLWKLRTNIKIQDLRDDTLHRFQSMFGDMEAHPTVRLLKGDKRFDGRPICVVVRPRIVSEPVEAEGRGRGIVWSPAQVWVSNWEDAGY